MTSLRERRRAVPDRVGLCLELTARSALCLLFFSLALLFPSDPLPGFLSPSLVESQVYIYMSTSSETKVHYKEVR